MTFHPAWQCALLRDLDRSVLLCVVAGSRVCGWGKCRRDWVEFSAHLAKLRNPAVFAASRAQSLTVPSSRCLCVVVISMRLSS